MAISVNDLKAFAAAHVGAASDEAALRASISRAYYAGFHAALPLVCLLPKSRQCPRDAKQISHAELSARLGEWKADAISPKLTRLGPTARALNSAIRLARTARVRADYELSVNVQASEAVSQLARAKQITKMVEQIFRELEEAAA